MDTQREQKQKEEQRAIKMQQREQKQKQKEEQRAINKELKRRQRIEDTKRKKDLLEEYIWKNI